MDILKAKKMYFDYSGSHFFMAHNGVYDTYKEYGISEEQERLWHDEYIHQILPKIEAEECSFESLRNFHTALDTRIDAIYLRQLLAILKTKDYTNIDTLTQTILFEVFLEIIGSFITNKKNVDKSLIRDAKNFSLYKLNELLKQPITVAPHYHRRLDGKIDASKTPIGVKGRIISNIHDWEKI